MNLYIIWPLGITIWLTIGWIAFAIFEAMGIKHNDTKGYITLSYFVYRVTQAWPPAVFLMGLAIGLFWGILCAHFFWHWCPAGSVSVGAILNTIIGG